MPRWCFFIIIIRTKLCRCKIQNYFQALVYATFNAIYIRALWALQRF